MKGTRQGWIHKVREERDTGWSSGVKQSALVRMRHTGSPAEGDNCRREERLGRRSGTEILAVEEDKDLKGAQIHGPEGNTTRVPRYVRAYSRPDRGWTQERNS